MGDGVGSSYGPTSRRRHIYAVAPSERRCHRSDAAKSAVDLVIPIHQDLAAVLDAIPKEQLTILTRIDKQPWGENNFRHRFRKALDDLGLNSLVFHGLRKSAGRRLAEAGCTDHGIRAITGHKTMAIVQRYTTSARQENLAQAAILKLERSDNKNRKKLSNTTDKTV